jgi:hypothetical protein
VAKEFFHVHEGDKAVKEMRIAILAKPDLSVFVS